jgi:beta-galactosidase
MSLVCSIEQCGGVPTVFVNGEPILLIGYKDGAQSTRTYQDFSQSGYKTAYCNIKIDEILVGPDSFDLSALHRSLDKILETNSNCYIILELHVNAPDWWVSAHPGEQQVDSSGQRYGQSMASPIWFKEACQFVRLVIRESEKYYGDHVVLYLVGAGHTWEWFYRTPLRYVTDCSLPMIEAFRKWLREKYDSDENLIKGWGIKTSIDGTTIPEWAEIITGDLGSIRDPQKRRYICDFFEFYNELLADLIIGFGKVVNEECRGKKLFGAFYGHILDWLDNPLTGQHSGHFCLKKVLESDLVNVLAGPNSYMDRSLGHEASFTSIVDSIKLHGKLWLAETDTRTSLADPIQDLCGRPETLGESLMLIQRDFCHALVRGVDMAWFSLFKGWFDDPAIMSFMAQARVIADYALKTDRSSVAQVAVFVDERSIFASTGREAYRVDPFISREPRASDLMAHLGCPYDIYLTSDLDKIDINRYKVFCWINSYWVDEEMRNFINARIKGKNRTLVWFGTPGIVKTSVDLNNVSDLIGMDVSCIEAPSEMFIKILWDAHPITSKTNLGNLQPTWVDGDFEEYFGTNQLLSPRICIEDGQAIALGRYSRDGKIGFALRSRKSWNSVFIGAPFAPPAILRQIARFAGVHIYNQSEVYLHGNQEEFQRAGWNPDGITNPGDDILYVNDCFLALHWKHKGHRRIVLPEPRRVFDVLGGSVYSELTDTIEIESLGSSTCLFYIGRAPWEELH